MNRDEPAFPDPDDGRHGGICGLLKGELSDLIDQKLTRLELILYRAAALIGTNDAKRAIQWAGELQRAAEEAVKHD